MNKLTVQEFRNKKTYISFFLSCLVVLIHTINLDIYGITSTNGTLDRFVYYLERFINMLADSAVPLFFILSGYLFFINISSTKDIIRKIKKRIFTLGVPLALWGLVYCLYWKILYSLPILNGHLNNRYDLNILYIFLPEKGIYNLHLWFICTLLIFVFITPIIYKLLKNKSLGIIIIIISIMFDICCKRSLYISNPIIIEIINYTQISRIDAFLIGSYIALNYKDLAYLNNKKINISSFVLLIALIIFKINSTNVSTAYFSLMGICLYYASNLFLSNHLDKNPSWIYTISFFTYCSHELFLEAIEKIILIVGGVSTQWALVDFIVAPILTMIIVYICAFVLRKTKYVWKILNGNR